MCKILLCLFLFVCSLLTNAQVRPTVIKTNKIIVPAKATVIRKDVYSLKMQLTQMSDSIAVIKKEIDGLANQKDSMSEMGEMESLRLQMAMDRLSRMMSTLSNIMKKASKTQQSITQNMK